MSFLLLLQKQFRLLSVILLPKPKPLSGQFDDVLIDYFKKSLIGILLILFCQEIIQFFTLPGFPRFS